MTPSAQRWATLHDRHQISAGDIDLSRRQYQFGVCKLSPALRKNQIHAQRLALNHWRRKLVQAIRRAALPNATQCLYDIALVSRSASQPRATAFHEIRQTDNRVRIHAAAKRRHQRIQASRALPITVSMSERRRALQFKIKQKQGVGRATAPNNRHQLACPNMPIVSATSLSRPPNANVSTSCAGTASSARVRIELVSDSWRFTNVMYH